jgi:transcription antitermination factor NusG
MPSHRTRMQFLQMGDRTGEVARFECSCGAVGEFKPTREAEQDAKEHNQMAKSNPAVVVEFLLGEGDNVRVHGPYKDLEAAKESVHHHLTRVTRNTKAFELLSERVPEDKKA